MSLHVDIRKRLGSFVLESAFEQDGGVLGLLGASGCGKSMTLKCIAGIEKPDEGRIVLDGRVLYDSAARVNLPPQQRQVGYLFQNYALFPNMTVRQNIAVGLYKEKDRRKRERELEDAIHLFQLDGLENHRPHQLSGGQQQRVALARIWVNRPQLLMLDEPFSALDSHLRLRLQMELKERLSAFGRDVLMVTHSRDEAYHMCGRIAVMESGKIKIVKETKELFADPESICAASITGCKNIASARKIGEYEVEVPDWGIRLTTAKPVRDDVTAVGIRAHYFNTKTLQNRADVVYAGEMEEPFEVSVRFRWVGQRADTEPLLWRVSKEKRGQQFPTALGVAPVNILLLHA